jgi:hypothetical protein
MSKCESVQESVNKRFEKLTGLNVGQHNCKSHKLSLDAQIPQKMLSSSTNFRTLKLCIIFKIIFVQFINIKKKYYNEATISNWILSFWV